MRNVFVAIQAFSFIALGGLLLRQGEWRLAVAQWLLAGVTVAIYS